MLNNLTDLNQKAKMAKQFVIADAAKYLALETILIAKKDDEKKI